MRFAKKALSGAAGAILASFLVSCGGSSSTAPANIRLVNLVPGSSLSDTVTLTLNGAAYTMLATAGGGASGYIQVTPGTYLGQVTTVGDSSIAPESFPGLNLGTNQSYTVFTYPRGDALYAYELVDNAPVPSAGEAQLSIANASPDAGPLNVWVLEHTSSSPTDPCQSSQVALAVPTMANVQGQQTSPYPLPVLNSSNNQIYWDVCVMGAQTGDERLSISSIAMASGQNYVLALTSSSGGALVNGALIEQADITNSTNSVALYPNVNIRVRLLVSLPTLSGSPEAEVSVTNNSTGNTTALTPLASGKYIPYQTLSYGSTQASSSSATTLSSSSFTITAQLSTGTSVPVTVPSTLTYTAGGDYSILVYQNSSGTPVGTIFADTNLAPLSGANIRVINAADYDSNGVELQVNDSVPSSGVSDVVGGSASSYANVKAGTYPVQLYSNPSAENSSSTPAGLPLTPTLNTGEVYSMYLYDLTQLPLLITDR